jgi:hypothetical protein
MHFIPFYCLLFEFIACKTSMVLFLFDILFHSVYI